MVIFGTTVFYHNFPICSTSKAEEKCRIFPIDIVKKKLQILKDKNIVRVKGNNPKYWLFDEYNFQRLDDDDDIFHLLCNFDDVDFDKYFDY